MNDSEHRYPTATTFCERVRDSRSFIRQCRAEIEELQSYSRSVTSMNYVRYGNRNSDGTSKHERLIARIDDLQRQYIVLMNSYLSERERAAELFDRLPTRIGELFRLRYLHGKDNAFILDHCGISRNTLPVWFRQGYATLEQLLVDERQQVAISSAEDTACNEPTASL